MTMQHDYYSTLQKLKEAEMQIMYLQERIATLKLQLSQAERANLSISKVIQEYCDENGEFNKALQIIRICPTDSGLIVIVR